MKTAMRFSFSLVRTYIHTYMLSDSFVRSFVLMMTYVCVCVCAHFSNATVFFLSANKQQENDSKSTEDAGNKVVKLF